VRSASLLALAAWLGASLLASAVVAPAAFAVLPTRTLAGALVGEVLPVLFVSGVIIGVVICMWAWQRARTPVTVAGAAAQALFAAVAQFVVGPRIHALREAIGPALDAVPPGDARRIAFGRLHGASVLLLGGAMLGACVAIAGVLRHRNPPPAR
jgi:hypothetical protein